MDKPFNVITDYNMGKIVISRHLYEAWDKSRALEDIGACRGARSHASLVTLPAIFNN